MFFFSYQYIREDKNKNQTKSFDNKLCQSSALWKFIRVSAKRPALTIRRDQYWAEVDQYSEITVNTLNELKYIDAILKETLRLQPTAPIFALQAKEDKLRDEQIQLAKDILRGVHGEPEDMNDLYKHLKKYSKEVN